MQICLIFMKILIIRNDEILEGTFNYPIVIEAFLSDETIKDLDYEYLLAKEVDVSF